MEYRCYSADFCLWQQVATGDSGIFGGKMNKLELRKNVLSWMEDRYPVSVRKFRFMNEEDQKLYLKKALLFRISLEPDFRFQIPISVLVKINEMVENQPELLMPEFREKIEFEKYDFKSKRINGLIDKLQLNKNTARRFPL